MSRAENRKADRQRRLQELHEFQQAIRQAQQQRRSDQLARRQHLRQQLRASTQQLAHDMTLFLDQATQERQAMAQAVTQSLAEFRSELRIQVANLRSTMRQRQHQVWTEQAQQRARLIANLKQRLWRKTADASLVKSAARLSMKPRRVARKIEAAALPIETIPFAPSLVTATPMVDPSAAPAIVDGLAEQVLQFVQQHPGLRLSQIEAEVGLNRVEAVNAVQVLINSGKVILRDRVYYAVDGGGEHDSITHDAAD